MEIYKRISILSATLLAVAMLFSSCAMFAGGDCKSAKEYTLKYLEKKYDQEFVITKCNYIWANKTYELKVYPKKKPDIKFDFYLGGIGGYGRDTYLQTLHSIEATKLVQSYINGISLLSCNFTGVGTANNFMKTAKAIYQIKPMLTLSQIINKYGPNIGFVTYAYCVYDFNEQSSDRVFRNVYKLYKFLKNKKITSINININFYPTKMFKNWNKKKVINYLKNIKNLDYTGSPYSIFIDTNDSCFKPINNYKDIIKYVYNNREKKYGF
ncbi:MAG: hypothetical protein GY756_13005 [bacterium]|nr:hypothetical protein [bacterium]